MDRCIGSSNQDYPQQHLISAVTTCDGSENQSYVNAGLRKCFPRPAKEAAAFPIFGTVSESNAISGSRLLTRPGLCGLLGSVDLRAVSCSESL